MVVFVKTLAEYREIIKSNDRVCVDFTASWCPPCRGIAPHFEALAEKNTEIKFIKVDVDDASDIAQEENINAMPTFKFYFKGNLFSDFTGASRPELETNVAKLANA